MSEISLWKEQYKIGNETIDEQHRELFHKVEQLLSIARTGSEAENRRECMELLNFLISYTGRHFESEEALQESLGYVGMAEHVKLHEQFKNTIFSYKEKVEKEFSKETLKQLAGTLMTWLAIHVCDCDKKIIKNQPISPDKSFEGTDEIIREVVPQLLSNTYGIRIRKVSTSVYSGHVNGKVIVRTIISGERNHVFLAGFSEEIARALYSGISGMEMGPINELDSIERSALIELGDILASYAVSYIIKGKKNISFNWRGDIFLDEYSDSCIDINNSVRVDFETDSGELEILYCMAG